MHGPAVQGGRFKVCSVGPDQGVDCGINPTLVEQLRVAQWVLQLTGHDRLKIDCLRGPVIKANAERVRRNDLVGANSMNRMLHRTTYRNGSIGVGGRPSRLYIRILHAAVSAHNRFR
jgi:hypothetical protein